jgi:hypothetical protein
MNVVEFYRSEVKMLPPQERLQLAKLILNDLPDQSMINESSEWTEEDLDDFMRDTWRHIDDALEEPANG